MGRPCARSRCGASAEELEAVLAVHEGFLDERGLACLPPIAEDVTFPMPPHPHWCATVAFVSKRLFACFGLPSELK
jgi:hypothetical protein